MNPYWENKEAKPEAWMHSNTLKRRFVVLSVLETLIIVFGIVGAFFLVKRAHTVPDYVGITSSGQVFAGAPVAFERNAETAQLFNRMHAKLFEDIITAVFLRTEEGMLPGLEDYLSPGIDGQMRRLYKNLAKTFPGGFFQKFYVKEMRLVAGRQDFAAYVVRGILTSRAIEGMQASEIFLAVSFAKGPVTFNNPLGFRLFEFKEIPSKLYFQREINEERQRLLQQQERTQ